MCHTKIYNTRQTIVYMKFMQKLNILKNLQLTFNSLSVHIRVFVLNQYSTTILVQIECVRVFLLCWLTEDGNVILKHIVLDMTSEAARGY